MVRQVVFDTYEDAAYTLGLSVYTTIRSGDQSIAERALREVLSITTAGMAIAVPRTK
jgi:membrane carboxypeptidase/penicillin-binding protein